MSSASQMARSTQVAVADKVASASALASIPNLGPKSAAALAKAGIVSLEDLASVGSVRAYLRAKQVGQGVSLNLLWALEGALTGQPWQLVAKVHRTSLLMALDDATRPQGTVLAAGQRAVTEA